jgi:superfamily II DNA or RNA helicase
MAQTVAAHPALGPLWDAAKNAEAATAVLTTSYKAAWWSCVRGHSFQRSPRALLRESSCPQCKVAGSSASLADKRPGLAALWHPDRNGDLTPATVDATSTAACWWRCTQGHDFQRAPLLMLANADCSTCALAQTSLAVTHATVAAEWSAARNGAVTAQMVDADHMMTAWWTCPKGHDYQATIRARARGGARCPTCYAGWSLEHIRQFVQALLSHIGAFDPSEKYALAMQAGLTKEKASQPFVKALTSGRFPTSELEKFARGEPSLVDGFAGSADRAADPHAGDFKLELVEPPAAKSTETGVDRFDLPMAPEPQDAGDIDVSREVDVHGAASPEDDAAADPPLPVVTTREALEALDSALIASADAETVKFLLDSAKAKLWRHAYLHPTEARGQAAAFQGDVYSSLVRDRFLAEFDEAEQLELPPGYAFRPDRDGPIVPPNLMQRRVAVCVRQARRFGNWSGMGAGKTLSAILATRVVGAGLTVVCCPNAVVANWAREIQNAFSVKNVATKTWTPTWDDPMAAGSRYLILNYEQFQQPDSEAHLVAFLEKNVVDFVVIDEIHYAKQRDAGATISKRKRLVQGLVLEAAKRNAELCVLGMSGTPVINTLQEGKSLVELITGHRHDDLETAATVQNCMRLYQRLVTLGTRWKPDYAIQLDVRREEIDCAADLEEIRRLGRGTMLELEQVLTRLRLPTILENIKPGEKVLIYTHYVDEIAKTLLDAMKDAGFRAGLLTGDTDDTDLTQFLSKTGSVDVLIASSRIGTGVDGLQHVCSKLIINCLPWTNAEYEQLIGRIYRQGTRECRAARDPEHHDGADGRGEGADR